jgi:hypothetical protein
MQADAASAESNAIDPNRKSCIPVSLAIVRCRTGSGGYQNFMFSLVIVLKS